MTPLTDFEYEPQDRAEVLDETNLTEDGREIANFDEIPDVFDATSAEDDDQGMEPDDDAAAIGDNLDGGRDDEGQDIRREPLSAEADTPDGVPTDADKPSDLEDSNPAEDVDSEADSHVDRQLDKGLKETFPASDPVSINPGAD
ncbi:MAG: primosomal protein [Caulobacter sp.]|nr:primosomal protein [Caulobacter sp.]